MPRMMKNKFSNIKEIYKYHSQFHKKNKRNWNNHLLYKNTFQINNKRNNQWIFKTTPYFKISWNRSKYLKYQIKLRRSTHKWYKKCQFNLLNPQYNSLKVMSIILIILIFNIKILPNLNIRKNNNRKNSPTMMSHPLIFKYHKV